MEFENLVRIAAIIAGLIALRFALQAVLRRRGGGGLEKLRFLLPPLITGGPMFVALPTALIIARDPEAPAFFFFFTLGGGLALMFGLMMMFMMIVQQQDTINQLKAQLESESTPQS